MLETYIRPTYQRYFADPLASQLQRFSQITPNLITYLSGVFGILVTVALYFQVNWLAIFFLLLSGVCDTLDGTLARLEIKSTLFGTALDIAMDRVVEFAVIVGLFLMAPETRGMLCLLMLGSVLICVTSFLVVGIFTENTSNKSFHYSPGLMERPEAFIFFIVMILLPNWFSWLAWVFVILVLYTAIRRIWEFERNL